MGVSYSSDFLRAVEVGRPPNIQKLFPNSKALIVSGKVIDRAMLQKGKAMTIAANARSLIVLRGALRGAQRANAAIIVEIAKSEGGRNAYCAINFWNLAKHVDQVCNELGITIPVAIHADHYGLKKQKDIEIAKVEIPTLFEAGITSIAIDASHLPDDENLLTNILLNQYVPKWAGLETEVGEIKGEEGLSTPEEALFLIRGLNAHNIFPDWIALNNGTSHGLQDNADTIRVDLTAEIHEKIAPYGVSGAQHGTSGNSLQRLKEIAEKTRTTKANVATALQMISWGLDVDDTGNAKKDENGMFIKLPNEGVTDELWAEMVEYAQKNGWKGGNYKNLNLPFENKILAQPKEIRERMEKRVEEFVFKLLHVFNAVDTAPIAIDLINKKGSYQMDDKASRIEDPSEWTEEKIREKAKLLTSDKGPQGNFDD